VYLEKKQVPAGAPGTNRSKFMTSKDNKISRQIPYADGARMVETIFGCKWSLTVYQLLADGINRPGQMVQAVEGLSTKVLNACLRKNLQFGILKKISHPEIPPRVEYEVTDLGRHFIDTVHRIQDLQALINRQQD